MGYLFAGYLIGPYSPGFVANLNLAEQLAEVGVVLMLFGVGLHFKLEDLFRVKNIAIPGAIGQTTIATIAGMLLVQWLGWPMETGIIIGLSVGVASTVVLVRILSDYHILNTPDGHIAVGWLIVEDLITVAALILVPLLAESFAGTAVSMKTVVTSLILVLLKFSFLIIAMFTFGNRLVSFILSKIFKTNLHELFTLTLLALTFGIALGSSLLFGTSIALGSFIAGMMMGQTHERREIAKNTLPLKETFLVIFFLSVGMLFNPTALLENYSLFLWLLGIILILKPLTAFAITILLKHSFKTALVIAFSLAQIGEFSFILAEQSMNFGLLPDEGFDVIVACSLISICLNPLLLKLALHRK